MIGSLIIYYKRLNNNYLSISLSFSMIIMIGISLFDLIPNAYPIIYNKYKIFSFIIVIILLIIGYIIIKIISSINEEEKGSLYKLGVISMIILIIHNVPEGIITFLTTYYDIKIGLKLAIAIMMHNIPEGILIAMPIYYATRSKSKAITRTLIASLSEPIGGIIAYILLKRIITVYSISILMVIVAGLMMSLAIEEIVPNINKYYNKKSIIIGIILGLLVIIVGIYIN